MAGGTIGRAADSTLLLPDHAKRVSRLQAHIDYDGSNFVIVDEGSNPGSLNGRTLPRGRATRISPGDQLVMGPYELVVEGPSSSLATEPGLEGATTEGVVDDPLKLFGGISSSDRFSQRPSGSSQAPAAPPSTDRLPLPERQAPPPAGSAQPSTLPIPEGFDPFAPPPSQAKDPLADSGSIKPPAGKSSLVGDLGPEPSIDKLWLEGHSNTDPFVPGHPLARGVRSEPKLRSDLLPDWDSPVIATTGSNVSEVNEPMVPPRMVPDPSTSPTPPARAGAPHSEEFIDPLLLFPEGSRKGAMRSEPSGPSSYSDATGQGLTSRTEEHLPPGQGAIPSPPGPSAGLPQPNKVETPSAGSSDELLAAFLEGAGVPDLDLRTIPAPALMRLGGQLLREATQGAHDLLYARRTTKHELRAHHTMMAATENNPLKFLPDAEAALRQLLSPPARGYMPPVRAMREAFDDLQAHHLGMIAGIRAALATLLERFDPAALEKQLGHRSKLGSMLPMNRNAQLWELFNERYQRLCDDAEEDFHAMFGSAFVQAYEEQIERLRAKDEGER